MCTQTNEARFEQGEVSLIRASQEGDTQAAEILFHRYRRQLLHTALRVTRNLEDAEDAVQDGFLSAYRNLTNFQGRSQFCTWLTRIVINAALMKQRKVTFRRTTSLEGYDQDIEYRPTGRFADGGPNPEKLCATMELSRALTWALQALSPNLRAAFVLREVRGYSTREAAKQLGIAENAFKVRFWRARHQLARRLQGRLERAGSDTDKNKSSSQDSGPPAIPRPRVLGARWHCQRVDRICRQPLLPVTNIWSSHISSTSS
jgi:RNA polymerase sigma-70 factor (ECF subfamily)